MKLKHLVVRTVLYGLPTAMRAAARLDPRYAARLARRGGIVQIRLRDGSLGRYFIFDKGRVSGHAGMHPAPGMSLVFLDLATAYEFLVPPIDRATMVHAAKNFKVVLQGSDPLAVWFLSCMNGLRSLRQRHGLPQSDGSIRYTTNTNGGPLFVHVKGGRILRCTPIDFDASDAPSWTIHARGRSFTPRRQATVSPYVLALKSQVYSQARCLYPMKRVDFDINGERNTHNRGKSGYVRISWDEAIALVNTEITRMKIQHGPGAIAAQHGSHHQWGNINYYLSAFQRFGNLIGVTRVHGNPDSWEGWYWGAQHHYGSSLRVGIPGSYGTVEDCLHEAQMIVFWSSDPESTSGVYGAFEGTQRRFWAREVGIEFVHIDPNFNPTAQLYGGKWIPIKPTTDAALAAAIMQVWIEEDLYDQDYVNTRTTGFDEWRAYLMGDEDGIPKTPEWQEAETGVPARVARALARQWGRKKTYLSAGGKGGGFGGACRNATGTQWARSMVLLLAMQGWGKPGVNFGNLQSGTPVDYYLYFPGYADGGISGDLQGTSASMNHYQRMPHVLSMNPVRQIIPKQRLPDAIVDGQASGHLWDGSSLEAQFPQFRYPMPGYSRIHMLWRYGGSSFGTLSESSRVVQALRHPSLECLVSQAVYFEGDTKFADIILPACSAAERWDIGETANASGYSPHGSSQLNHRTFVMQHKCIEPLGESKSDYQIFLDILEQRGLGAVYSEGNTDLDWCKLVFESSDLPKHISWSEFLRKGYYVAPAPPEALREPTFMRWFAEGRAKDVPEPHMLPAQYGEKYGYGLMTQSGKFEFAPSSLRRGDPDNPERPVINRYVPSWEGPHSTQQVENYPLQLISTHSRYSFHTLTDGKGTSVNDIEDHRVLIDGYAYWVVRIHPADAAARGIAHHDLVRIYNDRAAVLCAADVSELLMPGVCKSHESAADVDLIEDGHGLLDRGGCVNLLTPRRRQAKGTESMGPSACLVQIEKWNGPWRAAGSARAAEDTPA
jgi:trimethylamine-N-oxide reductase (cytochrome c)